jgi:hypothetical protein
MKKQQWTLSELMFQLQAAEERMKIGKGVQYVQVVERSGKPKGKSKKNKSKKAKPGPSAPRGVQKPKPQDKRSSGNTASFGANPATSRERDCRLFKASLQMKKSEGNVSSLFIIESNLISGPENSWCIDSGASVHVSNSLQGFKGFRKLSEGDVSLYMGNEARARVVGVGLCVISLRVWSFHRVA